MRRAPNLELAPLLSALGDGDRRNDEVTTRILDAAAAVLASGGLRRCTVEDIAEQGGIGRTTIYRRFDGRDEIVHAVLAREVRKFFDVIIASVEHLDRVEDRVVEGFLTGLRSARASMLVPLAQTEPELLRFLLISSASMMEMVTTLMVDQLRRFAEVADPDLARNKAEVLIRLAMSLAISPDSTLPLDDDEAARRVLHALFDPLLREVDVHV